MLQKSLAWYKSGKLSIIELASSLLYSYGRDYHWIMDMLRVSYGLSNGEVKSIISAMKNL